MISIEFAKDQIRRLSCCKGYDDLGRSVKSQLADALSRCARSEEHAKAVIDWWIENRPSVPSVADIVEVAGQLGDPSNKACDKCLDGFRPCIIVYAPNKRDRWAVYWMTRRQYEEEVLDRLKRAYQEWPDGYVVTAMGRCSCRLGKAKQF